VYSFIPDLENLMKDHGVVAPKLVGTRRASTFTGFCSRHDDAIFAPLEKQVFSGTPEQCFLLGYRALTREIYTKDAAASLVDVRRQADKGKTPEVQMKIQTYNLLHDIGLAAGLQDNQYYNQSMTKLSYENTSMPFGPTSSN
jgi:hypothetical protein